MKTYCFDEITAVAITVRLNLDFNGNDGANQRRETNQVLPKWAEAKREMERLKEVMPKYGTPF